MSKYAKLARSYNPPLKEQYSKEGNAEEESFAKEAIKHFVTDPEGSTYAMTPYVPELVSALLKARYSRTELSARQLLWREFVAKKVKFSWKLVDAAMEELDDLFNFKKAEGVAERILLQYGDDSVFELGGAHLFLDRVSMVASKVIEDARIGISPLEKSTRYVVFDQKNNDGDYSYFKDPKIMNSKFKNTYLTTMRDCFDFYAKSVQVFMEYFRKQIPIESQDFPDLSNDNKQTNFKKLKDEKSIKAAQNAYNFSVRSKACDVARVLLPASTFTNIGEFGNARAFGYLFTKMAAMNLSEMQMISDESVRELKKILPKFFDVIDNKHGTDYQTYLKKTEKALIARAAKVLKGQKPTGVARVELLKLPDDPEITIAAGLLYPYSDLPLKQIIDVVSKLPKAKRVEILHDALKFRTNRRHKPPRAFELPGYDLIYDIVGNFGIYRDLHRQRILTQQRQSYTTKLGFDMPVEFTEAGLDQEFSALMHKVDAAHKKVKSVFPEESQYLTTMANYTRWYVGMNLREAFWFTELRSVPQGHFSYRTIAQDMFIQAQERYPFLKDLKEEFVDMSDRSKNLERMEAMQRIQTKLAAIEDKDL